MLKFSLKKWGTLVKFFFKKWGILMKSTGELLWNFFYFSGELLWNLTQAVTLGLLPWIWIKYLRSSQYSSGVNLYSAARLNGNSARGCPLIVCIYWMAIGCYKLFFIYINLKIANVKIDPIYFFYFLLDFLYSICGKLEPIVIILIYSYLPNVIDFTNLFFIRIIKIWFLFSACVFCTL